jgi:hypothetical protein
MHGRSTRLAHSSPTLPLSSHLSPLMTLFLFFSHVALFARIAVTVDSAHVASLALCPISRSPVPRHNSFFSSLTSSINGDFNHVIQHHGK